MEFRSNGTPNPLPLSESSPILVIIPTGMDNPPSAALFQSSLFQVHIEKNYYPELTVQQNQVKIILDALRQSELQRPDQPVLLVFANMTSSSTPDKIHQLILESWNYYSTNPWDIVLFHRYLDQCDQYQGPLFNSQQSNSLVSNTAPSGSLAMLISPIGRDRLLGKTIGRNNAYISYTSWNTSLMSQIASGNVMTLCWIPNLLEYLIVPSSNDPTSPVIKPIIDPLFPPQPLFPLLSECAPPNNNNGTNPAPVGWIPFLTGLLITVIILILAWALYIIGPQPRLFSKFDETKPVSSSS